MNLLSKCLGVLLLCLTTAITLAQTPASKKQQLFNSLPSEIKISEQTLAAAFHFKEAEQASIQIAPNFFIAGTVISNTYPYKNLRTIIIRTNKNVLLSISKQWLANQQISYSGRIISQQAADGFLLKSNNQKQFYFQKFNSETVLQDCHF